MSGTLWYQKQKLVNPSVLWPFPSKSEGFERLPRHVSSSTGAGPRPFTDTAQWLLLAVLLHWTQSAHDQALC